MVWWVVLWVCMGVAGLLVLALLTLRLYQQVRQLGREVGAAAARIGAITAELERAAPGARGPRLGEQRERMTHG